MVKKMALKAVPSVSVIVFPSNSLCFQLIISKPKVPSHYIPLYRMAEWEEGNVYKYTGSKSVPSQVGCVGDQCRGLTSFASKCGVAVCLA
jgi:hypothetical protein